MYEDRVLNCRDCGADFVFTAGEQQFYAERGLMNDPSRCPECRRARRASNNGPREPRQMYDAVCSACGSPCQVPFQPSGDKPVYCSDCFASRRSERRY